MKATKPGLWAAIAGAVLGLLIVMRWPTATRQPQAIAEGKSGLSVLSEEPAQVDQRAAAFKLIADSFTIPDDIGRVVPLTDKMSADDRDQLLLNLVHAHVRAARKNDYAELPARAALLYSQAIPRIEGSAAKVEALAKLADALGDAESSAQAKSTLSRDALLSEALVAAQQIPATPRAAWWSLDSIKSLFIGLMSLCFFTAARWCQTFLDALAKILGERTADKGSKADLSHLFASRSPRESDPLGDADPVSIPTASDPVEILPRHAR